MERRDAPETTPLGHVNETSLLHDFMAETNFEKFIELIRGESNDPMVRYCPNYDCEHINGCLVDNQLFGAGPEDVFDFCAATMSNHNTILNPLPWIDDEDMEKENDGDESSATTTPSTKRSTKVDRSRTLISERRRRGRMKEKLYALRSLVPNITKMDKASIVGDAVLYVQQLQMQSNKLRVQIAELESSVGAQRYDGGSVDCPKKYQVTNKDHPIGKCITQMDMFQVEERGFFARLVCNSGEGVVVSLYKVLESLTSFNVQSSNLATTAEGYVLTFNLNASESDDEMNLPDLKPWVTGALLNQGFEFKTQEC